MDIAALVRKCGCCMIV